MSLPMSVKISVVIPLYNKELHIARAIDSVLAQSFQEFEIVVIDDGSLDKGADVVSAYDDKRIRLYRQSNAGVSVARNRGVELAICDVVAFLDADDAYYPDFLENILSMRLNYPGATAYAMNYDMVDPGGRSMPGVSVAESQPFLLRVDNFFRVAVRGTPVFTSAVSVDKKSLVRAGGFPVGVKLGEDIDAWIRILFIGPIVFDPRPGSRYYLDATNRAVVGNPPPARYVFFDTVERFISNGAVSAGVVEDMMEFLNSFKIGSARHQIKWGDRFLGRGLLKEMRTSIFSAEKRKLLVMSYLPQWVYQGLAKLKAGLRT